MKRTPLIGRIEEKRILGNALQSSKAEMVSVIGRRRIGKTFLVKSVYQEKIDFEITGIQHATRREQLRNFMLQISKYSGGTFPMTEPKDWLEAFYLLTKFLEAKKKPGKIIVFLDELPWLATHKSGFLKGLSWFWNSWATSQPIVVVICGSAASWMIKNVVHNKGGLHNRITKRIYLKPFDLAETEYFFKAKNLNFDRYQILHLYMAMGGVPHYLDEIEAGKSAAQNIDAICFSENGLLWDEFPKLYASLFENSETHVKIIRALAGKQKGLTRSEIVQNSRLTEGGGVSTVVGELLHSGFISTYQPFGKKKKDTLYRLTDEFSLFYLQFMENNRQEGAGIWQQLSKTQAYITWAGYAFENICLKHIPQIKKALGISGVYSTASSFFKKGSEEEEGIQFDLLIDRNDHVINICEIKFYGAEVTIDKTMAMDYRNKMAAFKEATHTRKQVFLTMITTFGVKQNQYSLGLVDASLTMDDLFARL
ncbi:MAG: ATP-binding protein [Saprospirales bacterium]|nr:ATP-binding protein [Saprospirales bacterium]